MSILVLATVLVVVVIVAMVFATAIDNYISADYDAACRDRDESACPTCGAPQECPGEWELGCDLGANDTYTQVWGYGPAGVAAATAVLLARDSARALHKAQR